MIANPSSSPQYQDLLDAVEKARNALLPGDFDPTGMYDDQHQVHLRTASFRLLVHAEIESYLESKAAGLRELAWRRWRSSQVVTLPLLAMLAFCEAPTFAPPASLGGDSSAQKKYEEIAVPIGVAYGAARRAVEANNGIKEADILRLFLPLGVPPAAFDRDLLDALNEYGTDRGSYAHAAASRVEKLLDPKEEFAKVTALLERLASFDHTLAALEADLHDPDTMPEVGC